MMTVLPLALYCQKGLFLTGGLEFAGLGKHYTFEKEGKILAKNWLGVHDSDDVGVLFNPEIYIHYHFMENFGISLGMKFMDKGVVIHDNDFMTRNEITNSPFTGNFGGTRASKGNFNINKWYFNPSLSGCFLFNTNFNRARPFLSFGIGWNHYISNSRKVIAEYYHVSTDEHLVLRAQYKTNFTNQYIEAGCFFFQGLSEPVLFGAKKSTKGTVASVSFRYAFIGTYMEADYSNTKKGVNQYNDHLSVGGSYFSVVVKVGGGVFTDATDRMYEKRYNRTIAGKSGSGKLEKIIHGPAKMNGREFSVKKGIVVKKPFITVSVWDHARYDKDIISISLNGKWILENDTLKTSRKVLFVDLEEEINYLAVYAISEGSEKPCTVSIIVDDGISEQKIVLNSDMMNSEALRIRMER